MSPLSFLFIVIRPLGSRCRVGRPLTLVSPDIQQLFTNRALRGEAELKITKPTPNRSSPEFADYLVEIVASYPEADTIHLVMDNLSSHNRKALADRFGEKIGGLLWERFSVHYTPKHGGWLNQAEIEISMFSRQCLGRQRIPSLEQLQRRAGAWNRKMDRDSVTINWQFTRRKARKKFDYNRNNFTRSETWLCNERIRGRFKERLTACNDKQRK